MLLWLLLGWLLLLMWWRYGNALPTAALFPPSDPDRIKKYLMFSQERHNKPIISRMTYILSQFHYVLQSSIKKATFKATQIKALDPSCSKRARYWAALWCQCSTCPFFERANIKMAQFIHYLSILWKSLWCTLSVFGSTSLLLLSLPLLFLYFPSFPFLHLTCVTSCASCFASIKMSLLICWLCWLHPC